MMFKIDTKTVLIGMLSGFVSKYIAPVAPFLAFAFILILSDMIVGIIAARKNKETLRDDKMRRTIDKTIAYIIVIFISHAFYLIFLESNELTAEFPLLYMVSITISITELRSIYNHAETITGVPLVQFIKKIKDFTK